MEIISYLCKVKTTSGLLVIETTLFINLIQKDMDYKKVMALIANEFGKGAASTVVINKSADSSMKKGRGENRNPYMGRVMIEKTYTGYVMGTDYKGSLENTATRMGNEGERANLKETWHKPCAELGEWFSTDRRTESKYYLKLQRNEKQVGFSTTTVYYLDGRLATDEETADIERWMKSKSNTQSSTQIEMGIDSEHEQHFILPQLDTVVLIKQKDKELYPQRVVEEVYAVSVA